MIKKKIALALAIALSLQGTATIASAKPVEKEKLQISLYNQGQDLKPTLYNEDVKVTLYDKAEIQMLKTEAVIESINDKNGLRLSLVGIGENKNAYDMINLNITDKTEIVNEKGDKVNKEDIKEGMVVEAYYGPAVTRSLPPIGNAEKIVVKNSFGKTGKAFEIRKSSKGDAYYITIGDKNNYTAPENVTLIVGEDTKIIDREGNKLSVNDIKEGTQLVAFHSMISTMSLPPQTAAKTIIVYDTIEKEKQEVLKTEALIKGIHGEDKMMISLVGVGVTDNSFDMVDLNITDKTEIVNEKGEKVNKEDIKDGMVVEAYYSPKLTKSLIPIGNADKIVVKNTIGRMGEIIEVREGKNLSATIGNKEDFMDPQNLTLIIGDETEIVDRDGKKISKDEIKEGAQIVAFHSMIMTASIPPQTLASKVIVYEKSKDADKGKEEIVEDKKFKTYGIILDTNETKNGMEIHIKGGSIGKDGYKEVILRVTEDTKIIGGFDNNLKDQELKVGDIVIVEFGGKLTKSLPPRGEASKVIKLGESNKLSKPSKPNKSNKPNKPSKPSKPSKSSKPNK